MLLNGSYSLHLMNYQHLKIAQYTATTEIALVVLFSRHVGNIHLCEAFNQLLLLRVGAFTSHLW